MHPWRERLARWFTPLARRIPFSPNTITIFALALNIVAATCLAYGARRPWLFLLAIVIIAVSGLADALDGIVARVQEKTSRFGDFLDHCADRAGDSLLAVCWLLSNGVRAPLAMAGIIMTMLNGYMGTQIEATYGVRSYEPVGRGEFVLGLIVLPIVSYILFTNGWQSLHFASLTIAEWLAAVMIVFAFFGVVQRFRVALRLERS
ncbi:MAG TPA: CDP-alcohol phosphatidyltransferase family protein [Thermoanaerobaculia bacterium]|jgi:archaetidylinositol phosphate synthase|nr:CDP-alcohol phosphatidyltransferase family protein [Thermoanaerobaculia bacterium]